MSNEVVEVPKVLKMYSQDHGWRGNIYVAAYSEEQARTLMSQDSEYQEHEEVVEEELVVGWCGGHCAA